MPVTEDSDNERKTKRCKLEVEVVKKSKGGSPKKKRKKQAGFSKLTKEQIRRREQKRSHKLQKKAERKKDRLDRKQKNLKELQSNQRRLDSKENAGYDIKRFMEIYNLDEATAAEFLSRV